MPTPTRPVARPDDRVTHAAGAASTLPVVIARRELAEDVSDPAVELVGASGGTMPT